GSRARRRCRARTRAIRCRARAHRRDLPAPRPCLSDRRLLAGVPKGPAPQSCAGVLPALAAHRDQQPRQIDLIMWSTLRSSACTRGASPTRAAPCPPPLPPDDCAVPNELVPGVSGLTPVVPLLNPVVPEVVPVSAVGPELEVPVPWPWAEIETSMT